MEMGRRKTESKALGWWRVASRWMENGGPDCLGKTCFDVLSQGSGFRGALIPGICVSRQRILPGIYAYKHKCKQLLKKEQVRSGERVGRSPKCWASRGVILLSDSPVMAASSELISEGLFFNLWCLPQETQVGKVPVFLSQLELSICKF